MTDRLIRIWDLPLRLFHWALAIAGTGALVSGLSTKADLVDIGIWQSATIDWAQVHSVCGYTILVLILWRLMWGMVGGPTARLTHLLQHPRKLLDKFKNQAPKGMRAAGHDALAGLAALALLMLFFGQAIGGLFINDDAFFEGPLYGSLDGGVTSLVASLHETVGEALPWIVGLHVTAILFYRMFRHINLLGPMITGNAKESTLLHGPADLIHLSQKNRVPLWRAVLCLLISIGAVYALTGFVMPTLF